MTTETRPSSTYAALRAQHRGLNILEECSIRTLWKFVETRKQVYFLCNSHPGNGKTLEHGIPAPQMTL